MTKTIHSVGVQGMYSVVDDMIAAKIFRDRDQETEMVQGEQ